MELAGSFPSSEQVALLIDLNSISIKHLMKSTNYEAPPHVIFSILLLLPVSYVQILSSALCLLT